MVDLLATAELRGRWDNRTAGQKAAGFPLTEGWLADATASYSGPGVGDGRTGTVGGGGVRAGWVNVSVLIGGGGSGGCCWWWWC